MPRVLLYDIFIYHALIGGTMSKGRVELATMGHGSILFCHQPPHRLREIPGFTSTAGEYVGLNLPYISPQHIFAIFEAQLAPSSRNYESQGENEVALTFADKDITRAFIERVAGNPEGRVILALLKYAEASQDLREAVAQAMESKKAMRKLRTSLEKKTP